VVADMLIFWSVSTRQLASQCENKVQRGGGGLSPKKKIVSFRLHLLYATGMYYMKIKITMDDLRLQRTILYSPHEDSYER